VLPKRKKTLESTEVELKDIKENYKTHTCQLLWQRMLLKYRNKENPTVIGAAPQRHLFTGFFRLVTVAM
jgi:hypothetical protein